jgi:phosphate/sulfate permease
LGNFALISKPSFFYNIFMFLLLSGFAGLNISTGVFVLLLICILAVCFFEFINGFHDTANAVATVIYTKSLEPTRAVVLSGILNFVGVVTGGLGVAMGILKLLPLLRQLLGAPLASPVVLASFLVL